MSSRFCVIRSGPLGNRPIADVMKGLVKRFGRGRIIFHKPMNLESFTLLREGLAPLDAFVMVSSVIVSRQVGHERADREPYIRAIRSHSQSRSRMNLTVYGTEAEDGGLFECCLSYGWQMKQKGDNFTDFSFRVAGTSLAVNDLSYRRDLFLKIIDIIGLTGIIRVDWEGDELRVLSTIPGLEVAPILARLSGGNPLGISIRRFSSIDAAVDSGEKVLERVLRRVDNSRFTAYAEGKDGYDMLRPLSANAQGWMIQASGGISESAGSVLAGKPTEDAPSRVPAFIWEEKDSKERYSQRYYYSGELVATDEGCCLELTTDRNDLDRLMDYASSIDGLSFRQMDQAGP